ncbi:MAG: hypothetical protein COW00_04220 [Bdellovibrio sp. CG12_big_fil_rev_8_21_14_0_65_39_13]|nr:MAG: hypothetical protein COW78_20350 [Bdellovibrio sp. CG22_combo_CG10-13_8_21_14_all_39_27]PIQ61318.1 MAG: hypothetical protein COW00_04220 [Bdellovibrio sp. CG12_big_fil_rev_8_21_14_0_65_39_13]PIR33628.1 MAG: hypothetical protein COV37_15865 [Bdellovibrio sp. CG11_big_fil_rev_8_21_14_0_20_39_38]PJB53747.1 MAG: hypothetical protein CO099_05425 [Bdellovibrio sp. CG_4_9_14_3_um_filter_39_7]
MDLDFLREFSPELVSWLTILMGIVFSVAWYLDHLTHVKIWEVDITDNELKTHKIILYASWVLQVGLLMLAWNRLIALPIILGAFITRFTHEFIDEMKFHVDRCSFKETIIHLIMWISINTGTAVVFLWGFLFKYKGFGSLPLYHYVLWGIIFVAMGVIGNRELNSYQNERSKDLRKSEEALA